jgi:hypothetical protein
VVQFNDTNEHNLPKAKAFYGKWIIPPDEDFGYRSDDDDPDRDCFAVAVTGKGNAVIYAWRWDSQSGLKYGQHFEVYPSLEVAASVPRFNIAARQAIERVGVPVEELDI